MSKCGGLRKQGYPFFGGSSILGVEKGYPLFLEIRLWGSGLLDSLGFIGSLGSCCARAVLFEDCD